MKQLTEEQITQKIPELIASWFNGERGEVSFEKKLTSRKRLGLLQTTSGYTFLVEVKTQGSLANLSYALKSLKNHFELYNDPEAIPILAVPFMGEKGRELCAEENISWLDLSGNANISAPGLRILIDGKRNAFKATGRPKNLFAPKSSRLAREFLIDPGLSLTQRELTRKTGLNETLVGRIVREMERDQMLLRNKETGAVSLQDPELMLEEWREAYDFDKHLIIPGFIAQRTGEAAMQAAAEGMEKLQISYAATGLAGAWLLTQFANFRLTTIYLSEIPSDNLLKELKISKQSKTGANIWLVVPNDAGVFAAAQKYHGVNCVHPVQVYLDLSAHPERATDAAKEVRSQYLNWRNQK